jgi:MFS family permease
MNLVKQDGARGFSCTMTRHARLALLSALARAALIHEPMSPPLARRGMLLATLFAAQVCGSTGFSMTLAVGAIMAAAITGTNTWSGLPVAVSALGGALASWPLSRLMSRLGRRRDGLALGYMLGVVGAALGITGMLLRSFTVFLAGMTLFGVGSTSNLLARYAAADVSPGSQRGRAMGLIVWGSTVGAIIGPNLMAPAARLGALVNISSVASSFLISVAAFGAAAFLIHVLLRPDPLTVAREIEHVEQRAAAVRRPVRVRPAGEIFREPRVIMALAAMTTGQLVMIGTTSTAPLYLHDQGHQATVIGLSVSIHLGGMYVGSPLSGWLCDRFGRLPMIALGGAILLVALAIAGLAPGTASGVVMLGLFLNGIGWNLAFVSGSALLTDALSPEERTSIQGLADLATGLMGALGSALGGMILGTLGFAMLNALFAVMLLVPAAASWLQRAALTSRATENPWAS